MYSIVYVSSAREPFTRTQLRQFLQKTRKDNERRGVTGILLHRKGSFMQLLEGTESVVETLFERITRDPRHWAVTVMHRAQASERMFPEWSMACRDLGSENVRSLPGFSRFLEPKIGTRAFFEDPTRAQKLLVYFKESLR